MYNVNNYEQQSSIIKVQYILRGAVYFLLALALIYNQNPDRYLIHQQKL